MFNQTMIEFAQKLTENLDIIKIIIITKLQNQKNHKNYNINILKVTKKLFLEYLEIQ